MIARPWLQPLIHDLVVHYEGPVVKRLHLMAVKNLSNVSVRLPGSSLLLCRIGKMFGLMLSDLESDVHLELNAVSIGFCHLKEFFAGETHPDSDTKWS